MQTANCVRFYLNWFGREVKKPSLRIQTKQFATRISFHHTSTGWITFSFRRFSAFIYRAGQIFLKWSFSEPTVLIMNFPTRDNDRDKITFDVKKIEWPKI